MASDAFSHFERSPCPKILEIFTWPLQTSIVRFKDCKCVWSNILEILSWPLQTFIVHFEARIIASVSGSTLCSLPGYKHNLPIESHLFWIELSWLKLLWNTITTAKTCQNGFGRLDLTTWDCILNFWARMRCFNVLCKSPFILAYHRIVRVIWLWACLFLTCLGRSLH